MQRSERGVTLSELMVAIVLCTIVMLGIVVFYFNSQSTWLDASAQGITQRDGTIVLEHINDHARGADSARVTNSPNGQHQQVTFYKNGSETCHYFWSSSDSLLHWGDLNNSDNGALVRSKVDRVQYTLTFSTVPGFTNTPVLVTMSPFNIRSARNQAVQLATAIALYNHR